MTQNTEPKECKNPSVLASKETARGIRFSQTMKSRTRCFTAQYDQMFKELIPMFLKLFYKVEVNEWLNSLYEAIITLLSKANNNVTKNKDY